VGWQLHEMILIKLLLAIPCYGKLLKRQFAAHLMVLQFDGGPGQVFHHGRVHSEVARQKARQLQKDRW
jgi:hypothetical protein